MKNLVVVFSIVLTVVLVSCNANNSNGKEPVKVSRTSLKEKIKEMEDSLMKFQNVKVSPALLSLSQMELINRLTNYYRNYPEDPYAADCLFKVLIKYSDMGAYRKSVAYGDTILQKFPSFENRDFILESNASTYDVFIEPRDTAMVRKYYNMLLTDVNFSKQKKKEIRKRLAHLEMDLFEFSAYNMKKQAK
jgi:hypothetical protein